MECVQRVVLGGVVRHQVSVSSCVSKQFALVFRDNNHYQLDRVITVWRTLVNSKQTCSCFSYQPQNIQHSDLKLKDNKWLSYNHTAIVAHQLTVRQPYILLRIRAKFRKLSYLFGPRQETENLHSKEVGTRARVRYRRLQVYSVQNFMNSKNKSVTLQMELLCWLRATTGKTRYIGTLSSYQFIVFWGGATLRLTH